MLLLLLLLLSLVVKNFEARKHHNLTSLMCALCQLIVFDGHFFFQIFARSLTLTLATLVSIIKFADNVFACFALCFLLYLLFRKFGIHLACKLFSACNGVCYVVCVFFTCFWLRFAPTVVLYVGCTTHIHARVLAFMHVDFSRHKRTTLRFCLINTQFFDHLYYSHHLSHIWCNSFVLCLIFVSFYFWQFEFWQFFTWTFLFSLFSNVCLSRVLCGLDSIIVQFCALNVLDEFPRSTFPKCISCPGSIGYLMLSLLSLQLWLVFSFIWFFLSLWMNCFQLNFGILVVFSFVLCLCTNC